MDKIKFKESFNNPKLKKMTIEMVIRTEVAVIEYTGIKI